MKNNKIYDEEIRTVLLQEANQIEPSEGLFDKIKKGIYEQGDKGIMENKVRGIKKGRRLAIMVASFIIIGSLTVMGVNMGKSWVGYTDHKYKTFPSEERVLKDVGFLPKYPESLPGGFEYANGGTGESTLSEAGDVLTKTKEVTFGYKRGNEKPTLTLSITEIDEMFLDNNESQLVGDLNGIELYYYQQAYKFVPADYELTEEDKRVYDAGELEISYGSSEIEYNNVQGLSWYEDGLQYMIMGSDYDFTVEEMIGMAKAIIEQ